MRQAIRTFEYGKLGRAKLVQLIHVKAGELGLSSDIRKDIQIKMTGKESCIDMNERELAQVCQRLATLAQDAGLAKLRRRKRPGRDERQPAEPPTPEQLEKIRGLFDDLGVSNLSSDMMALSRRITGHAWPQSREEANKLIEGLKAMKTRGWRARGASAAGDEMARQAAGDTVHESPITP